MKRVILCCWEHDKSFIWCYYTMHVTCQKLFWIWIRICVKKKFLHNFVNSTHTDMYDTSNESCAQRHYFFLTYLRALSNLWGRYDPKTEKSRLFAHNWIISSHRIMCNASYESFTQAFISLSYTGKLGAIYEDVMTQKHENLMIYRCFQ